ncbi:hypothetical protein AD998_06900 [bacterium 336/3]|nr:hypothetical protein AD998_06900 [bacterium 336/3]
MYKFIKKLLRNKEFSFKQNTLYLIFVFNLYAFNLTAQILNDSTQNVYGVSTTLFTQEYRVIQKKDSFSKMDTSLKKFHSFDLVRKNRFLFQDLGHNLGTPAKSIFYTSPSQVGVQWGMRAYDFHKLPTDSVRYYDSRSPYTDFTFIQGGRGQQIAGVEFTRNINAHFNFGFKISRTNTFRQFAESGNRTENAILEQYNTLFWARYFSKNQKYKLLFHYYNFSSPLKELGGVKGGANPDTLYSYDATIALLEGSPKSWHTYNRLRLYHEYSFDSTRKFSFFQVVQFERERDNYVDESYLKNQQFYIQNAKDSVLPVNYIYSNGVYDDYKFRLLTNQIGIRTSLRKAILLGYFKRRDYELNSFVDDFYKIKNRSENYLGGQIFIPLPLKSTLEGKGEYWIGSKDYLLEGVLNNRFLQVFIKSLSVSPTLMENRYVSRIANWNNQDTLKNTFVQELFAQSFVPFKFGFIKPSARYQIITNHTYFIRDTAFIFPIQAKNTIQVLQFGLETRFSIKNLHFENQIFYTQDLSSSNIIRFPEWHLWGSWYYQKSLFKNALLLKTGIDWHYRTGYYADAYMPATKQFYLQDTFFVRAYPIVDIFASLLIKKTRVFLKMSHVNDGILAKPDNGYVVTPFYAGLRRTFSLGFSWRLFD